MLKYSTGRSKPGWGKLEFRPVWWPNDLPWANVRSDVRTEQEKKAVSVIIYNHLLIYQHGLASEASDDNSQLRHLRESRTNTPVIHF